MTKIKITHGDSTYILTADFGQAADTLYLDGAHTPFQVADTQHRPEEAVKLVMEWLMSQSGDEGEYDWEIADTLEPLFYEEE
jgi:hypothetical protein